MAVKKITSKDLNTPITDSSHREDLSCFLVTSRPSDKSYGFAMFTRLAVRCLPADEAVDLRMCEAR